MINEFYYLLESPPSLLRISLSPVGLNEVLLLVVETEGGMYLSRVFVIYFFTDLSTKHLPELGWSPV
jgi:hypothetical protein